MCHTRRIDRPGKPEDGARGPTEEACACLPRRVSMHEHWGTQTPAPSTEQLDVPRETMVVHMEALLAVGINRFKLTR